MGNLASCLVSRRSGEGRGAVSITKYIPTFTQMLCQRTKVLYFTLPYLHLLKINVGGCCNTANAPKFRSLTVLVEEFDSEIDSQIIKSLISSWRLELAQLSTLHWSSVKTFPLLLMILWIDLLLFVHSVNCFYPLTDKQFAVCEMWRMASCQL